MSTDRALLASQALGRPVGGWIADLRAQRKAYRVIAKQLRDATGLRVSHETVRSWDPTRYRPDQPA